MKQHLHTRAPITTTRWRGVQREHTVKIGTKVNHLALACAIAALTASFHATAHQRYRVVVLPPEGGPDSYTAGYLGFGPLSPSGTVGISTDTSASPGAYINSYTWTVDGRQTQLQHLPPLPDWTGTSNYINWINRWGVSAGFATRMNTLTAATTDNAVIWLPDGKIYDIQPASATQSHAVWINELGQVSGWVQNSTASAPGCSFGNGGQTQGFIWQFGVLRPLGTLGGIQSYGEFINDLGQVSGHSETSATPDPTTGCPPFDPFIWQDGKMTDINPGNFGGAIGGTNALSNGGQAVGFGYTTDEVSADPFLWQRGQLTNLSTIGSLGGAGSALGVNDSAHVVGVDFTADFSLQYAVLWRDGTFTNLGTLGYDCSRPFGINNRDQIVGFAFSCETGAVSAFIWEDGEMVDLNALIPADSGLQVQYPTWIDEDGVISAQGVLTAGASSGDTRALLLIPAGACDPDDLSAAVKALSAKSPSADATGGTAKPASLRDRNGRIEPRWLRPLSPAQLRHMVQHSSD
jgi:probable HAF family extracellular repeat protein